MKEKVKQCSEEEQGYGICRQLQMSGRSEKSIKIIFI